MSLLIVVLDANVLFPASLRDTLLRATQAGLYTMRCTEEILEEVERNLVNKGQVTESQARRLTDTIRGIFPEAFIIHHRLLIASMTNDPKDRHVLATAVACRAQIIVTSNLQDFPQSILAPFGIVAQSPDEFLIRLFHLAPEVIIENVEKQARDLRNPPRTTIELLANLAQHAPNFVNLIRGYF